MNPLFTTAEVSWTNEGGINNENLRYSLYLDDELVVQDIVEQTYTLEDLNYANSYNLRAVAKNESGETLVEIDFQTLNPDDFSILLSGHSYPSGDRPYLFEYDSDNRITSIKRYEEPGGYVVLAYESTYDAEGKLKGQTGFEALYARWRENFYYENDQVVSFTRWIWNGDGAVNYYYEYVASNTINLTHSDDWGTYETYDITLQRDSENRVTHYRNVRNSDQAVNEIEFVYEDENLIRVIEVTNNSTWDIEYDTNSSWLTFYKYNGPFNYGPLPDLSHYMYDHFNNIFDFISFKNKNNPVKISLNGEVQYTNLYEYHDFGFPSKITRENGWVFDLEYTIQ